MSEQLDIDIIEWPEAGSAQRWPMGGWYAVVFREGRGYWPLSEACRTREEAEQFTRAIPCACGKPGVWHRDLGRHCCHDCAEAGA